MSPVLSVTGLSKSFGGIHALKAVDLQINPGQIVGLIGPNGAGKTTFFNCLTGVYQADQGSVALEGAELVGKRPDQINRMGIARTFQNIRLFSKMRVIENVMVGRHGVTQQGLLSTIFKTKKMVLEEQETLEKCAELLKWVGLEGQENRLADQLAYADQRRLEIARALASEPKVLMLDEPAAGMNHTETADLDQLILAIREQASVAVLLIEHDMRLVMNLSEKILVMDQGAKIAFGSPAEIQSNRAVIAAYLGQEV